MSATASSDAQELFAWLSAAATLSYYDVLGVSTQATPDELRQAFHAFAAAFHPDGHAFRPAAELAAVGRIFRHGTEAYRVLEDPQLRARYDEALARGEVRPETLSSPPAPGAQNPPPGIPRAPAAVRLVDRVVPAARPFVLRAEELLEQGDLRQAKLQLKMAAHLDPGNAGLAELAKAIDLAEKAR